MLVQLSEYTENNWIVYFKRVNFVFWEINGMNLLFKFKTIGIFQASIPENLTQNI